MQVARLVEPRSERSLPAKLRQMVRAVELERTLGKSGVLNLYLALAPYGGPVEGVRAASLAYFGREPARLSFAESALLVALPQAPELRRPDRFSANARRARDRVLDIAAARGVLTADEAQAAKAEPVPTLRKPFPMLAAHAAEQAHAADPETRVQHLTLDARLQASLEALAAERAAAAGPALSAAIDLGDEQRAAVRMALLGRFGLLVGGAGVGKTTVLKAVVAASEHFGRAVHQMALAGRAAVRMTQATGRKAWTIAAFLNGVEARRIVVGPEALVVVDESSMLDLPTLYRILRAIPTSGRLLLVGDPAQLPPIGFGLTLHALVATPKMPKVELRTIRRQSTASGIPMVAAAVREGRVPKLAAFDIGVAGVSLLECRQEEVADRSPEPGSSPGSPRRGGGICGDGGVSRGTSAASVAPEPAVARQA